MSLLNGIKVIDAAQFNAGPIVSMYLALMGADVIKVESLDGDDSRSIGPFSNNESSFFMSLNRGKRSISINGRDEFHLVPFHFHHISTENTEIFMDCLCALCGESKCIQN